MGGGLSSSVWNRTNTGGAVELGESTYIAAVSGATVLGLIEASVLAYLTMGWQPTIWSILLVGLVIPIVGIIISVSSDEWAASLFGYLLVTTGIGAIIGPTVALYQTGVVITALMATAGVTMVMSIAGIMFPDLVRGWGKYLFAGLVALILVRVGQMITISMGLSPRIADWPLIDYLAALLFTVYIMYDWGRAMDIPHTLDNAIDSAVAIFLDIANLFLNLLRIFGHSSSND